MLVSCFITAIELDFYFIFFWLASKHNVENRAFVGRHRCAPHVCVCVCFSPETNCTNGKRDQESVSQQRFCVIFLCGLLCGRVWVCVPATNVLLLLLRHWHMCECVFEFNTQNRFNVCLQKKTYTLFSRFHRRCRTMEKVFRALSVCFVVFWTFFSALFHSRTPQTHSSQHTLTRHHFCSHFSRQRSFNSLGVCTPNCDCSCSSSLWIW